MVENELKIVVIPDQGEVSTMVALL